MRQGEISSESISQIVVGIAHLHLRQVQVSPRRTAARKDIILFVYLLHVSCP